MSVMETHLIMKGIVLVGGGLAIEGAGMGTAGVHRYQTTVNTVCKCLYDNQYVYALIIYVQHILIW